VTVSRVWEDHPVLTSDDPNEPRLSYVVARLERAIRRAINERVQPYGLTTLQYTTLSVLGRRGALSNAQLARRSYMSPQAMSEVIAALEQRGLIERSQHPNHRRVYPAGLTPKGHEVLAACEAAVDELEAEMFGGLDEASRRCLRDGLVSAVRHLHAGLPDR
jgi:DNA-binding MarR family transcriptional regulator